MMKNLNIDHFGIAISIPYGVMNYYWVDWIIPGRSFDIIFGLLTFGLSVFLVNLISWTNIWKSLMVRVGIAIGMIIWGFYMMLTTVGLGYRATPEVFYPGNLSNFYG